jgi:hypothetical protein
VYKITANMKGFSPSLADKTDPWCAPMVSSLL